MPTISVIAGNGTHRRYLTDVDVATLTVASGSTIYSEKAAFKDYYLRQIAHGAVTYDEDVDVIIFYRIIARDARAADGSALRVAHVTTVMRTD